MFKSREGWAAAGVAIGLAIGLNVAGLWPRIAVQAYATHADEHVIIATGPVGQELEGIFILDKVAGDLKGACLNLQTCKFSSVYQYNVSKDLLGPNSKNPTYLMVTGQADMRRGANGQLGSCVVYVAEVNSGKLAAYGIPWVTGRENLTTPFQGTFVPLDGFKFRTVGIR